MPQAVQPGALRVRCVKQTRRVQSSSSRALLHGTAIPMPAACAECNHVLRCLCLCRRLRQRQLRRERQLPASIGHLHVQCRLLWLSLRAVLGSTMTALHRVAAICRRSEKKVSHNVNDRLSEYGSVRCGSVRCSNSQGTRVNTSRDVWRLRVSSGWRNRPEQTCNDTLLSTAQSSVVAIALLTLIAVAQVPLRVAGWWIRRARARAAAASTARCTLSPRTRETSSNSLFGRGNAPGVAASLLLAEQQSLRALSLSVCATQHPRPMRLAQPGPGHDVRGECFVCCRRRSMWSCACLLAYIAHEGATGLVAAPMLATTAATEGAAPAALFAATTTPNALAAAVVTASTRLGSDRAHISLFCFEVGCESGNRDLCCSCRRLSCPYLIDPSWFCISRELRFAHFLMDKRVRLHATTRHPSTQDRETKQGTTSFKSVS